MFGLLAIAISAPILYVTGVVMGLIGEVLDKMISDYKSRKNH